MKLLLSIALTPILSIVNVTQATQADVNSECLVYGKVIKVTDGDTVKVLDADHVTHKIRLA